MLFVDLNYKENQKLIINESDSLEVEVQQAIENAQKLNKFRKTTLGSKTGFENVAIQKQTESVSKTQEFAESEYKKEFTRNIRGLNNFNQFI